MGAGISEGANVFLEALMGRRACPVPVGGEVPLRVGLDLGTASIVLVVLDGEGRPLTWDMEECAVVRDGLVVDFAGARVIVARLRERLEGLLGRELTRTAIAVPPGTGTRDCAAHGYVAEGAGLEVVSVLDEPTAANAVLGVREGAIVDIGGGTTGVSILRDGAVVSTTDEPTGGTHVSLVIAGNRGISIEDAETLKRNPGEQKGLLPIVKPVLQKMATIVGRAVRGHDVKVLYLVGGTCTLAGIERIIEQETGIPSFVPPHPFLVTPAGIARSMTP